jgi:hypothetical protein
MYLHGIGELAEASAAGEASSSGSLTVLSSWFSASTMACCAPTSDVAPSSLS